MKGEMANKQVNLDFLLKVLHLTAEVDAQSDLWWRTDGDYAPATMFVNCSDTFYRACADCEELTPENIHLFEEAFGEVRKLQGDLNILRNNVKNNTLKESSLDLLVADTYVPMLFCAKVRKMRPLTTSYPSDERLWSLFDACGPIRDKEPVEQIILPKVEKTVEDFNDLLPHPNWWWRLWAFITNLIERVSDRIVETINTVKTKCAMK